MNQATICDFFEHHSSLKKICESMNAKEFWCLDDENSEFLNNLSLFFNTLTQSIDNSKKHILFDFLNKQINNICEFLTYSNTTRTFIFLAYLEYTFPNLVPIYIKSIQENYPVLSNRLDILANLNMLSSIFENNKENVALIMHAKESERVLATTFQIDNFLDWLDSELDVSDTQFELIEHWWDKQKVKTMISDLKILNSYPSPTIAIENDSLLKHNLIYKLSEFQAYLSDALSLQPNTTPIIRTTIKRRRTQAIEDASIPDSFLIMDVTNQFENSSTDLSIEYSAADISVTEHDKIKELVTDYYRVKDDDSDFIDENKAHDEIKNYQWINPNDINHYEYDEVSAETSSKIKKIVQSITAHKPILEVNDFSIFDEINQNCPNFKEVTSFYKGSFILNQSKPSHIEYSVPMAILLIGEPGIGKTHFAKNLANVLDTDNYFIDANSITASWVLTGSSPSWRDSAAGLIFKYLNKGATVSPVIIFDEIDKLSSNKNYDPFSTFHQLLEPINSKVFTDEFLNLSFDASKIIYILSANNLDGIPESLLSRMKIFHIEKPSFKDSLTIAQRIYDDIRGESELFHPLLSQENCRILAEYSPRVMRQIISDSVYSQAANLEHTRHNNLLLKSITTKSIMGFR